ncbi:hypothetical protein PG994_000453 [Apiospora phragmitis]|uniref:Uncharacterized protein n=1 Tax=Apiospora phragmitis TaxID=2905665 RepID=A0ABR1X6C8_9PEZI
MGPLDRDVSVTPNRPSTPPTTVDPPISSDILLRLDRDEMLSRAKPLGRVVLLRLAPPRIVGFGFGRAHVWYFCQIVVTAANCIIFNRIYRRGAVRSGTEAGRRTDE